ncbi:MAG: MopE-related protein [Polyangiaceae bacterium]
MRPERALLHPLWIGALLTQIVNDHVLKGGGVVPGVVTGKLSDLAVLVVAPPVLAILVRARGPRAWVVCHLAIGALFTALELSDGFTALFARAIALFGFPWVTWSDWTDLLTLPALLLSWSVLGRSARAERTARRGERLAQAGLAMAAAVTCLATSAVNCPQAELFDRDGDGDGFGWTTDCDDEDVAVHPGAVDTPADDIDQNCDGHDTSWIEQACAAAGAPSVTTLGTPVEIDTSSGLPAPVGSCTTDPAGARVLIVQPPEDTDAWVGWLTVEVASSTPHTISLRTDCLEDTSEQVCAPTSAGPLRVLVRADAPPLLVVTAEGAGDAATVTVTFEPIVCGDGQVVEPEACDDGNVASHDGCSAVCEVESAGGAT